jgi:outer membrane protein
VNYTIFSSRNNLSGGAYSVDSSSFGAVGQVGMDYMFDKNWGLNVDLKYATMATNVTNTATGANVGKLTLNPWMPAVGVTYKF